MAGRDDSDDDIIVVAQHFQDGSPMERAIGLRQLWYEVGGVGPMDLICLTPERFPRAREHVTLVATVLPEAIELVPDETRG